MPNKEVTTEQQYYYRVVHYLGILYHCEESASIPILSDYEKKQIEEILNQFNKEIKKEKPQYIQHVPKLNYVKITLEQYEKLKKDYPNIDIDYKIDRLEDYVACSKNKNKYKDWNRVLRRAIRENWFTNQQQNYNSQKHIAPVPYWYEKYLHDLDHNEEMKNAKPSKEAQELADSLFNDAQKKHDEPVDPELEKLAKDIFND